ncbi:MAG: DUF6520 family protein [Bacteroidota bacterium]
MKKYLIGLCAIVLVIGSAFVVAQTKTTTPVQNNFYRYTGPSVDPATNLAPYQIEANWTNSSSEENACSGGDFPCKVEVNQSSIHAYVSTISTASDVTDVTIATKE